MATTLRHLENLRATLPHPLDRPGVLELWTLILHEGGVRPEAAAWLRTLPVTSEAAALREALLASAPCNPEWEAEQARDVALGRRVAALRAHARPGDLVFWRSLERGFPWWVMRAVYGPWMHVSVVLADGRLLDPYWPEGAVIVTPEAAMAKNARRIRATELLVARPSPALAPEAVARLTVAAEALVGRPYGLLSSPEQPAAAASCARNAWELLRAEGVDLLATRARLLNCTISPRDILPAPVAWIQADGSVARDGVPEAEPEGAFGALVRWVEQGWWRLSSLGLDRLLLGLDGPLTVAFMRWMTPAPLGWDEAALRPEPGPPQGSG
ncbi:MAG: hypothetical protein VKQ33_08290 [Candidatus Sericytochromatia bacterium]|nr:hypothetical protein [Candidatus Sericytochromatia bacterium]